MTKLLTPKGLVELGIGSTEHVLGLIHSGDIKASNVSRSSTRPRWVITEADLQAFLDARSNQQKATKSVKRRPAKPKREYV